MPLAFDFTVDKKTILLLAQDLKGSKENARSFLNSFKLDIQNFDHFLSESVQRKNNYSAPQCKHNDAD